MLVFYATYVVTQIPHPGYDDFDPNDTLYKTFHALDPKKKIYEIIQTAPRVHCCWYGSNNVYTEGDQYIKLTNVKVLANNANDGESGFRAALEAASGGGEIGSFTVIPDTSINIQPYATRLAAIQQLAGMVKEPVFWGWDPDFFFVSSRGSISFDAEYPGVTVNAGIKNDGTITRATVIYSDASNTEAAPEDRRVLAAWVPTSKTFDVNGDGTIAGGENAGLIDGSYILHSAAGAAAAAQSYIEERGITGAGTGEPFIPQWEGTITLKGIATAAATKVATKVTCGAVGDAIITGVSVDVDSDTVTLSLGGTGYAGRFPGSPGQPNSASPSNAAAMRKTLPYQTRRR